MPDIDLSQLTTEQRNPETTHIDELATIDIVRLMNEADQTVPQAIAKILPDIALAVDLITARLAHGGRLCYIGAGTSGRLGILDAVECPPTFSTPPELVQGFIAGGTPAIFRAQEGAEDDPARGRQDLEQAGLRAQDVVVGIAASGRTPYVIGALDYARSVGAAAIALACSEHAVIADHADLALLPITGPEILTGSTRLKAGTAQKLVLNMLSTATMIKLGKTYGNLMVDVKASNAKLTTRARHIVSEVTGCTDNEAATVLRKAGGQAKLAILMQMTGCTATEGHLKISLAHGRLAEALRRSRHE